MSRPSSQSEPAPSGSPPLRRRRRWLRLVGMLVLGVGLVWILHAPLLRAVGNGLVVHESWPEADFVLICSGDSRYDLAAEMLRSGTAGRILLIEGHPSRTERYGIEPPPATRGLRRLKELGVDEDAILVERASHRDERELAAWLAQWLAQQGHPRVLLLSDRSQSGSFRRLLDSQLPPDLAACFKVHAMPSREFDADYWWLSPRGIRSVLNSYIYWGQDVLIPYGQDDPYEWDYEAYAENIR